MRAKTYLGDGVYAVRNDLGDIELTTARDNDVAPIITNRIVLDDYVIKALKEYLDENKSASV